MLLSSRKLAWSMHARADCLQYDGEGRLETPLYTHTGQWKENMASGQGIRIKPNGDKYEGEWKAGQVRGTMSGAAGVDIRLLHQTNAIAVRWSRNVHLGRWMRGVPWHVCRRSNEWNGRADCKVDWRVQRRVQRRPRTSRPVVSNFPLSFPANIVPLVIVIICGL